MWNLVSQYCHAIMVQCHTLHIACCILAVRHSGSTLCQSGHGQSCAYAAPYSCSEHCAGGLACLLCAMCDGWLQQVAATAGQAGAAVAASLLYGCTLDLFPTSVRAAAMHACTLVWASAPFEHQYNIEAHKFDCCHCSVPLTHGKKFLHCCHIEIQVPEDPCHLSAMHKLFRTTCNSTYNSRQEHQGPVY